jgi:hypothetical protein
MVTETTMNVSEETYQKLVWASELLKIKRGILVSSLINYSSKMSKPGELATGLVKYQKRSVSCAWHQIHLRLRNDEHDFFMDLRKVWKLSVSLILAEAIEKYLEELIFKMIIKPDNYRYRNYASSRFMICDVVCWVFYWGIPPEIITTPG